MIKFICLIITIISLLLGCDASRENLGESVVFYYIRNEIEYGSVSGVITPTAISATTEQNNFESLLKLYFNGPTNYACISPFAAGTTMTEFSVDGNKAQILLSPHMATLQDSAMTVALACLTRTVVEMTGVTTVQIRIQNNKIYGEDSITLSPNNFTYFDEVTPEDAR